MCKCKIISLQIVSPEHVSGTYYFSIQLLGKDSVTVREVGKVQIRILNFVGHENQIFWYLVFVHFS